MLETSLIQYLLSASAVAALVDDRIYPIVMPQTTDADEVIYPAITIQLISDVEEFSQSGPSNLARAIVQINSIGELYLEAKELAAAVRDALNGIRGDMEGTTVQGCFRSNETESQDRDYKIFTVMTDYEIHYQK